MTCNWSQEPAAAQERVQRDGYKKGQALKSSGSASLLLRARTAKMGFCQKRNKKYFGCNKTLLTFVINKQRKQQWGKSPASFTNISRTRGFWYISRA